MDIKGCIAFILFLLSVSAMDSDQIIIPAAVSMCSLLYLLWRSKKMVKCRKCGFNFDPADIRGGICDDCREEERQRMIRAESVQRMMRSPSEPIRMDILAKTILGIGEGR